jgi:hypothetical protein
LSHKYFACYTNVGEWFELPYERAMNDLKIAGFISSAAAAFGTTSVTIATITTPAPGILGVIGLTTTTTVVLPAAGLVAAGALVAYGVSEGVKIARQQSESH